MKSSKHERIRAISLATGFLFLALLACSGESATESRQAGAPAQGQAESQESQPVEPVLVAENTATPTPPPPTATPLSVGLSRANPLSRNDVVSAHGWDVQILDVVRGEDAWQTVSAANQFNKPPAEGMEYLLVRLNATSTHDDSDEHSIGGCDFSVTGDRLTVHSCGENSFVAPDPVLNGRLYSGGSAEGWVGYSVAVDEGNLMLVIDEMFSFDDEHLRFVALDEGASIGIADELQNVLPTDSGTDRSAPAPRSEKVVTDDWEVSVLDIVRGEDAWRMVEDANQFNGPPDEGMEYIAVKVRVKNIGTDDKAAQVNGGFFRSTGGANVLYDSPYVVAPAPALGGELFPGGETEGWATMQAAIGETGMIMAFEPWFDFSGQNKRFISLEP